MKAGTGSPTELRPVLSHCHSPDKASLSKRPFEWHWGLRRVWVREQGTKRQNKKRREEEEWKKSRQRRKAAKKTNKQTTLNQVKCHRPLQCYLLSLEASGRNKILPIDPTMRAWKETRKRESILAISRMFSLQSIDGKCLCVTFLHLLKVFFRRQCLLRGRLMHSSCLLINCHLVCLLLAHPPNRFWRTEPKWAPVLIVHSAAPPRYSPEFLTFERPATTTSPRWDEAQSLNLIRNRQERLIEGVWTVYAYVCATAKERGGKEGRERGREKSNGKSNVFYPNDRLTLHVASVVITESGLWVWLRR